MESLIAHACNLLTHLHSDNKTNGQNLQWYSYIQWYIQTGQTNPIQRGRKIKASQMPGMHGWMILNQSVHKINCARIFTHLKPRQQFPFWIAFGEHVYKFEIFGAASSYLTYIGGFRSIGLPEHAGVINLCWALIIHASKNQHKALLHI